PAGVPQALEQRLRIVLDMPGNEMNVAAQSLVQQAQDASPWTLFLQHFHGRGEVLPQLEHHSCSWNCCSSRTLLSVWSGSPVGAARTAARARAACCSAGSLSCRRWT